MFADSEQLMFKNVDVMGERLQLIRHYSQAAFIYAVGQTDPSLPLLHFLNMCI